MDSERKRIVREWFAGRVGVAWDDDGTRVVAGRLLLGCYSTLTDEIGILVHEMGHLVEIDDRRATQENFGLRYKRVVRLPPTRYHHGLYAEPLTSQGVERECRVVAISTRILSALGWGEDAARDEMEKTLQAFRMLGDWYNIPGARTDEARREWCRRKVARTQPQWPVERVRAEWWRKVVLVTKRLERAERKATQA